jgi:uncharacterized integral membrane protein (TIGR00698 family)
LLGSRPQNGIFETQIFMSHTSIAPAPRRLNLLEKNLLGVRMDQVPRLLPGLLVAAFLAWFSMRLSDYIGVNVMGFNRSPISAVMMAILLGLLIGNLVALPKILKPGFSFAVKKVLRLGIILLGIRLSIFSVLQLGVLGVPIVLVCILGALIVTTHLNKWLGLPERLGALVAVGTSICGVSAIVATGPAIEADEEEITYAVAVITTFGIFATLVYPYVASIVFAGDPVKAGLFLGTSIQDTSQVTGAALVFADVFSLPRALDVATVTKLVRNVFMAAVIPFMAFYYARRAASQGGSARNPANIGNLLPLFVVGFLACAVLRSIGDAGINAGGSAFGVWGSATWESIHGAVKDWAVNSLVVALAGVGLSTRFSILKNLGVKPFVVGLGAALTVGVLSFVAISLLGTLVTF